TARLLSDVRFRDALLSPPPRPRGRSSRVCRASAPELRARLRPRLGSALRRGARRRRSRRQQHPGLDRPSDLAVVARAARPGRPSLLLTPAAGKPPTHVVPPAEFSTLCIK